MKKKFLFDENIAPVIVEYLSSALANSPIDIRPDLMLDMKSFLRSHGSPTEGVWDEVWFPRAIDEGFTIVAGDRGKQGGLKKGRKLPELCATAGVIHFLLSPKVHSRRTECKFMTILSVWSELIFALESKAEIRFVIEPASNKLEHECKGKLTKRKVFKPKKPSGDELFPPDQSD